MADTEYTRDEINADTRRFNKERREMSEKIRHLFPKGTELKFKYRGKVYDATVERVSQVSAQVKLKLAQGTSTHKVDLIKLYDQAVERGEAVAVEGYQKVKPIISNYVPAWKKDKGEAK